MTKDRSASNAIQSIYYIDRLSHLTRDMKTKRDFLLQDELLKDGVLLGVQTICEYANKIDVSVKEKYNDVPWKSIREQRNFIAHDYGNIDYGIVWKTFKEDIPKVREKLIDLLHKEYGIDYNDVKKVLSLPKIKTRNCRHR